MDNNPTTTPVITPPTAQTHDPLGSGIGTPLYQIKLTRCLGLLIVATKRTQLYRGTYDQCVVHYKEAQKFNLLFGWWSVFGLLVWNWMALFSNRKSLQKLQEIAGRT